ncbi:MAG TPA: response regulator [Blastocatellia bacterium]|nr:response regulator [Blastocatellia bacterium]
MAEKIAVLVIDDEPSIGDALRLILSDNGFDVSVATTGSEGLQRAALQPFDVAVTDIRLPDMSGLDVLSRIRKNNRNCPIIMITAHCTPEIVAESLKRGAVAVLSKPFCPSEVLDLIDKTLGR